MPASLGRLPADVPHNRLGLAKWLVSPANPLTARVAGESLLVSSALAKDWCVR